MATAYVKGCTGQNSGVSSIAATFSGNVTNGDIIACVGMWASGTVTFTSFSKTSGTATIGSFSQPDTTVTSGTNRAIQGWALVTGTGTATITLTLSGSVGGTVALICHDISGGATSSPVDGAAHGIAAQASPGTGANGVVSPTVTTVVNGDYLFGFCWDLSNNASSVAAGTGYTIRDTPSTARQSESQIQAAAGSTTATFTTTGGGGDTWINGIMALQPLAVASTFLPQLMSMGMG